MNIWLGNEHEQTVKMWQWRRSKWENWTCFTRMLPRHSIQAMGLLHHQQHHQKQYHSHRYPCVHAHIHLQAHTHARAHTHYALIHHFHVHHWAIHNMSLDFLDINNAVCLLMLSSTYAHTHTHTMHWLTVFMRTVEQYVTRRLISLTSTMLSVSESTETER